MSSPFVMLFYAVKAGQGADMGVHNILMVSGTKEPSLCPRRCPRQKDQENRPCAPAGAPAKKRPREPSPCPARTRATAPARPADQEPQLAPPHLPNRFFYNNRF